MSLRRKLLLAQLPLAAALVVVGSSAVWFVSALSVKSQLILRDNYRSALAMERIKESIERLDSAALFVPLGRRDKALAQIERHRGQFDAELKLQEGNITELGEDEATRRLRHAWIAYQQRLAEYLQLEDQQALAEFYFRTLDPAFLSVKQAANEILALNQKAMVGKSDRAKRSGRKINVALASLSIAACVAGTLISLLLTNHMLAPLSILTQGVNRLAEGDFQSRAFVSTNDEIGRLAAQFNAMANHLLEYRNSSLGELLLAKQAAKSTIDSLSEPVIIFTSDGSVQDVNRAAESLLSQGQGQTNTDLLTTATPELRAALEKAVEHVLHGKGPYLSHDLEDSVPVPAIDGQRWYTIRATPVYDAQRSIAGATVVLQDVTRQQRFDELRNDLVATVAHEFRTPLTSLRLALHLCLEGTAGPITEKQADLLQAGREDCQRLQTMVDELLDLARIRSGKIEIRRRPISVQALVDEAIESMQSAARRKGLSLEQEGFPIVEDVLADVEQIQLVFSNLITNAIRHTSAGGTIRVSGHATGNAVRFDVTDSGEGIAPEHQAHIFQRFYRASSASSGGAGLGLALCKEIIEGHRGTIGVVSEPGKGSTFWFTLPSAR